MKIYIVIGNLEGVGGTERVSCELAAELTKQGHRVHVISAFGNAQPYFNLPDSVSKTPLGLPIARGNPLRLIRSGLRLGKFLRYAQPDAVILVDTILMSFIWPWSIRRRYCLIAWEHFSLATDHGTVLRRIGRYLAARGADAIVVLTARDANAWRRRYRISNVQAIPNPAPRIGAVERQSSSRRTVLAVGRLTFQKGFDVLLSAWAQLRDLHSTWCLRIVGEGELREELEEMVAALHLQTSVEMPGNTKDMGREYAHADVLAMTSRWEGLPMTLLEALQAGLPVVSTDCPTGPREVLGKGAGLLVPVDAPDEFASALRRVIECESTRETLSARARASAKCFHPERIGSLWLSLFKKITGVESYGGG